MSGKWSAIDVNLTDNRRGEEPPNLRATFEWDIEGVKWGNGLGRVKQQYTNDGVMVSAVIEVHLGNKDVRAIDKQEPERALAFRGGCKTAARYYPDRFALSIVTIEYRMRWHGVERFMEEVECDRVAIRAWLESDPTKKPEPIPSAAAALG